MAHILIIIIIIFLLFALPTFTAQPLKKVLPEVPLQIDDVKKTMSKTAAILLDAFVDSFFEFIDQPLLPSQVLI